jgi:hypothetical protein
MHNSSWSFGESGSQPAAVKAQFQVVPVPKSAAAEAGGEPGEVGEAGGFSG